MTVSAAALPHDLSPTVTERMACGDIRQVAVPVVTIREHRYDFTGDGVPDAIVAVRCDTGAGNPPSAVFALAAGLLGPEVVGELVDPAGGGVVSELRPDGAGLSVVSRAYSEDAPRCCPDVEVTYAFQWDGERFAPGGTTRRTLTS